MQIVTKPLAEVFGANGIPLNGINAGITIPTQQWEAGDDTEIQKLIPPVEENYRFRNELVRDFFAWQRFSKEPLFLFGPTGCGKSSFVKQAYARLGTPVYRMTINEDTELAEMFGHYVLAENGQTAFRYGPVSLAAKHGVPVLLDEIGRGNPAVIVGLNGLFEGGSFTITGNGETVVPKDGFRIILTDNTNLAGDESGNYNTAAIQDKSIPDRIGMALEVGYPVDEEKALVGDALAKLADDKYLTYLFDQEGLTVSTDTGTRKGAQVTREDFINGILQVRDMVRKQSRDCGNQSASALERTMSVRSLIRWVNYVVAYVGAPSQGVSALHYALERALTNTCTPSTKVAIHAMVKSVFGVDQKLR